MNEIDKIRIGFALALLASLFALQPIIEQSTIAYLLFGVKLTLKHLYICFSILLGFSVYFYSISLINDSTFFRFSKKVGNLTYSFALIVLPIYIGLYLISIITRLLLKLFQNPLVGNILKYVLAGILGMLISYMYRFLYINFSKKDKSEKINQLIRQEETSIERAKILISKRYYDIAIVEVWKTIESAIQTMLFEIGYNKDIKNTIDLINIAKEKKLIAQNTLKPLDELRKLRNQSIHKNIEITSQQAKDAIELAERMIYRLSQRVNACYYCNRTFARADLEHDDITGAYVCKSCAQENPDWQEELMAMGMDP
ncbi:HEPN domain-containing protein [candidate division KSB1 bacterium]|nr:HEPN domain-containing protein [candidate division KSB1 bacterium]